MKLACMCVMSWLVRSCSHCPGAELRRVSPLLSCSCFRLAESFPSPEAATNVPAASTAIRAPRYLNHAIVWVSGCARVRVSPVQTLVSLSRLISLAFPPTHPSFHRPPSFTRSFAVCLHFILSHRRSHLHHRPACDSLYLGANLNQVKSRPAPRDVKTDKRHDIPLA